MNDPYRTIANSVDDPNATAAADSATGELPELIGRYRVEKILGQGGFGVVYLARDEQLNRHVAIKVPRRKLIGSPRDAEAYLTEARTVANLDHPNIVPVHDIGSSDDYPYFIVSKFIAGRTLAAKIAAVRPTVAETAALVATVADALHYAHIQGLVHRDVKPGNVLLDTAGKPYVADFGLALKEEDIGHGPEYAGTPAYMSPEQARGEGHRVDGRSDIFSLGVVLYEMLTGRRPFKGQSTEEILDLIATYEPRPPRQLDDSIPKELERICLKAMSKRASERYTTAKDMADDLKHFALGANDHRPYAAAVEGIGVPTPATQPPAPSSVSGISGASTASANPVSLDNPPIKILPRGLRSFDAHDVDFFIDLLPGPRDRDGLPESLRFWKTRIEDNDHSNTFAVGLIYGPSGCGKSSLVKAGLLPRLSEEVVTVFVEATALDTETRLLHALHNRCRALRDGLGLKEMLAALRRGQAAPAGKKVLIVVDQFEQWLHANNEPQDCELVQALRQCDGDRVKCIVMVRADFWMAATRFMSALEIHLVEGQNSAAVESFPLRHATKVLAAYGRAFGALPEVPGEMTKAQTEFLRQVVAALAQDGKVLCIRLAFFAEMVKDRQWTPSTLKELGGAEGIGVAFLEETFSAATAAPERQYHQHAARAVLKALLPEAGTDLKGAMRSRTELLAASGYADRPRDFDSLIRILDNELHLIGPTDPAGNSPDTQKYYQLTHDFLVAQLSEWLTRKQKETSRGRAELLLADRAAVWNTRPENRQLPSLLEWVGIRMRTLKRLWTSPQRKMMRQAARFYAGRGVAVVVFLAVIALGAYEIHGQHEARALVVRLHDAQTSKVPGIVREMAPYRRWLDPLLRDAYAEAESTNDAHKQLHASLALLPADPTQPTYLYTRLLDADPYEAAVIRDELFPYRDDLLAKLWTVVAKPGKKLEHQRLRAAYALATYDPDSERWLKVQAQIEHDLISVNPVDFGLWTKEFTSIFRTSPGKPLLESFRVRRSDLATAFLANYAEHDPALSVDLIVDADEKQFAVLFPIVERHGKPAAELLLNELDKPMLLTVTMLEGEHFSSRQANAAVALLRLGHSHKVWGLLKHISDPRLRSHIIHRFRPLGVDAGVLADRLEHELDMSILGALLLGLGEFDKTAPAPAPRVALLDKVRDYHQTTTDPGLRGAAEWLLRQWGEDQWLRQQDEKWATDGDRRERKLDAIRSDFANAKAAAKPQWYVNVAGQTMVVFPGPLAFLMGWPPADGVWKAKPLPTPIDSTFAIATKPITWEQFLCFRKGHLVHERYVRTPDSPVTRTGWNDAAAYCNWLSKKEGIAEDQWGYELNEMGQMRPREHCLKLTGYRLPTEAEMEYACRAESQTLRYYGNGTEFLGKYGWYQENSGDRTRPVGSLKPNDFGLFDMHGNVWCWCHDFVATDKEEGHALRGGSFYYHPVDLHSSSRIVGGSQPRNDVGFRPARTIAAR